MVEHDEEIHLTIAGTSETTTVVIEDNGGMIFNFNGGFLLTLSNTIQAL